MAFNLLADRSFRTIWDPNLMTVKMGAREGASVSLLGLLRYDA